MTDAFNRFLELHDHFCGREPAAPPATPDPRIKAVANELAGCEEECGHCLDCIECAKAEAALDSLAAELTATRQALARLYDAVDEAQKIDNTGGDSAVSVVLWSWAEQRHNLEEAAPPDKPAPVQATLKKAGSQSD